MNQIITGITKFTGLCARVLGLIPFSYAPSLKGLISEAKNKKEGVIFTN
jgi:hypothetical protein